MNVFTKNPNLKKIVYVLFFFVQGGGGERKGMARVSECLTMDPNKKMLLEGEGVGGKWRDGGGGGGGEGG